MANAGRTRSLPYRKPKPQTDAKPKRRKSTAKRKPKAKPKTKAKAPSAPAARRKPEVETFDPPAPPLDDEGRYLLELYKGEAIDPKERERQRLVKLAKATVRSRVLQSREDPNAFLEYAFHDSETGRPLRQARIHRELQDDMSSGDDVVEEFPRDHGKTTQVEGHAIWRLGNNPNLRIKFVCASDSKAVERLFAIIQHIRLNSKVHDVFPWLRPAALGDWTKHKIVVERDFISRDASIEALGVLSTATGGRADLLFADDVVDRRNALELPKLRETIKTAWDSDWSNILEPNAQCVYIGTPWHKADLTHKLKKNEAYRVTSRPVGDASNPFAPIWEEKWPEEALRRRRNKIGKLEFDRGFRLLALSGEYATVQEEWIQYWDEPPDLGELIVFQAFDVSSGTSADFFADVTIGVSPRTLTIYVLEASHAKLTFLKRAEEIQVKGRRWRPSAQGLEQETMSSLSQYLDETTLLSVVPLRPHLSKRLRLLGVTPLLERGQVKFNPALRPDRIANKDEHGDLVGELVDFPLAPNDDLVDAFVHAIVLAQYFGLGDADDGLQLGVSVLGSNGAGSNLLVDGDTSDNDGGVTLL